MKTNHLLSTICLSLVLVFTSCSNARYGSRMTRVKADKVVQDNIRTSDQVRTTKAKPIKAKAPLTTDILASNSQESAGLDVTNHPRLNVVKERSDIPRNNSEKADNATSQLRTISEKTSSNGFENLDGLKRIKKAKQHFKNAPKMIKKKAAESSSDRGLIMTLLIVILVLIIINLILDILPGFVSAILSVVLLVILILWLLQML